MSREKGFFLLLELVIVLLLFLSFYAAVQSYSPSPAFYLPSRAAEVVCYDLLSIWVAGESDVSSLAQDLLPASSIAFSPTPIFASRSNSFSCHAFRFARGIEESLYILIEW